MIRCKMDRDRSAADDGGDEGEELVADRKDENEEEIVARS